MCSHRVLLYKYHIHMLCNYLYTRIQICIFTKYLCIFLLFFIEYLQCQIHKIIYKYFTTKYFCDLSTVFCLNTY